MNWSMITWAPFAKSPNWASHSTSALGEVERVAPLEAEHAGLAERAVVDIEARLVLASLARAARVERGEVLPVS
jgi:hypothetical protein